MIRETLSAEAYLKYIYKVLRHLYTITRTNSTDIDMRQFSDSRDLYQDYFNNKNMDKYLSFIDDEYLNLLAPKKFDEWVRVCNLTFSSFECKYYNEELIKKGVFTTSNIITSRDDLYRLLAQNHVSPVECMWFSELVGEGELSYATGARGIEKMAWGYKFMGSWDFPNWFGPYCRNVKYLSYERTSIEIMNCICQISWFKNEYEYYYEDVFEQESRIREMMEGKVTC